MMTVLDEQGTPWRNKTEMDEEDDAKEYVATAGAISSIANGSWKNHFSLSVSDITISIVPPCFASMEILAFIIPSAKFAYTSVLRIKM